MAAATAPRWRRVVPRLLLALLLLAGLLARLAGAWIYSYTRNPDYAVVVQMARNIAAGRDWPVFFYGQAYMGSLEPSVSALLVRLFGPDPFFVCLGTALIAALMILVVTRWAVELGGILAGIVTAALVCIGPTGYFHYTASPRGGYALALVLTLLLLRAGARLAWQARHRPTVPVAGCFALGLWGGLGFWNFWLTLPALAAAGILLLAALRGRILRLRVWLPGALGFLLGSLPFWRWNLRHAWSSFDSGESTAGRGQPLHAVIDLFRDRLPRLLDAAAAPPAKMALIVLPYIFLLLLALILLRPRRRVRWTHTNWALAAILLYAAFFGMAYALSSFSIPPTARYLLPLIPLFALLAGLALATLAGRNADADSVGQTIPVPVRLLLLPVATLAVVLTLAQHVMSLKHHQQDRGWYDIARKLPAELIKRGADAAFADYVLYGLNWATDESFCFSSPLLERYRPFAKKLEDAQNPAVLENFQGFGDFLLATGTSASFENIANLRLHSNARPPAGTVRTLPRPAIRSIRNCRGKDVTELLTDGFASTAIACAPRQDVPAMVEIEFAEPTLVSGLRFLTPGTKMTATQSITGRPPGEEEFHEIIPPHVPTPYRWAGERFYFDKADPFEEKRFEPQELAALRICFHRHAGQGLTRISEVVVLQPDEPAQQPDVPAIAAALRQYGATRVHANRWLANQLRNELDDTIWVSCSPKLYRFTPGESIVVPARGTAILTDAAGIDSVRQALQQLDLTFEEELVGQTRLVLIGENDPAAAAYCGLEISGDLLIHAYRRALASFWVDRAVAVSDPATRENRLRRALAVEPCHAWAEHELLRLLREEKREEEATRFRESCLQQHTTSIPINAAFFNEGLILTSLLDWDNSACPGDEVGVVAEWSLAPGFQPPAGSGLCLHFVRDGRIQFQSDEKLIFRLHHFNKTDEIRYRTYHIVRVPPDAAPGEYTPLLGIFRSGLLSRRAKIETELPLRRRRIELPTGSFRVEP